MSNAEYDWFQAITASQFNPAGLSGTFQPIFTSGFPDNIKVMHLYNGFTASVDVSFDGTNLAFVLPSTGTMIVDLQANHADNPSYGAGTLNGRAGQNVWVRTSESPTFITVGGYR